MVPLAEGIETEEQWRFLVEQGCTLGQGFYFSRPVPAEEIVPRVKAGLALPPPRAVPAPAEDAAAG